MTIVTAGKLAFGLADKGLISVLKSVLGCAQSSSSLWHNLVHEEAFMLRQTSIDHKLLLFKNARCISSDIDQAEMFIGSSLGYVE